MKQRRRQGDQASPGPDKPLYVLRGSIATPPMSRKARVETGYHLRRLQQGEVLVMPVSRPMPAVGANCHELRIGDAETRTDWRVIYCLDDAAVLALDVFKKVSRETPESVKAGCRDRLRTYLAARQGS